VTDPGHLDEPAFDISGNRARRHTLQRAALSLAETKHLDPRAKVPKITTTRGARAVANEAQRFVQSLRRP
jgi:hypothetical protein